MIKRVLSIIFGILIYLILGVIIRFGSWLMIPSGVVSGYISQRKGWISGLITGLVLVILWTSLWLFWLDPSYRRLTGQITLDKPLMIPAPPFHPVWNKDTILSLLVDVLMCTLGGVIGEILYRLKRKFNTKPTIDRNKI